MSQNHVCAWNKLQTQVVLYIGESLMPEHPPLRWKRLKISVIPLFFGQEKWNN